MNAKDSAYHQAVVEEKKRLLALSDSDLRALPEYSVVDKIVANVKLFVGLWHHPHPDGFEVFVAQAKRYILFGYGHMFVEGFILRPDGSRDMLPDQVFYDYA